MVPPENLSNSTLKITASISNTPKALRHQPETCSNFYCNFYGDTTDKIIEKSTRKKVAGKTSTRNMLHGRRGYRVGQKWSRKTNRTVLLYKNK